jgi:hypothetical protein
VLLVMRTRQCLRARDSTAACDRVSVVKTNSLASRVRDNARSVRSFIEETASAMHAAAASSE